MLNDYTYMIEVERHRDAIDFAARQRLSQEASKQTSTHLAWIRAALTSLRSRFAGINPAPTKTTHHNGPGAYHGHAA